MNGFKQLHWPLIIGLGAFAFVPAFLNITGIMDWLGRPFGTILMTAGISLLWLAAVLIANIRQPILTLTCTGFVQGLIAFMLGVILAPIFTGAAFAPLANPFILPFALGGTLAYNTLWGLMVGVVAWVIQQARQPSHKEA